MAKDSIQKFQDALLSLVEHKKGMSYEGSGMRDTDIVGYNEQGIPLTEAMQKTEKGKQWQKKYIVDPLQSVPGAAWNAVMPEGWRVGKDNWIIQSKADVAQRKVELQQMKDFRDKRDNARDKILDLAEKGKAKYTETGDTKYLDLVIQAKNDILAAEGLTDIGEGNDFVVPSGPVLSLRDAGGLFSSQPNPYPVVEDTSKFLLGTYGMIKGDKIVVKHFLDGVSKGFKQSKGNYLKRSVGAILGGAFNYALADYGYEAMLDIQSRAGQAKKWMQDPNVKVSLMDAVLGEVVPDAWTFGGEGINRPTQQQRLESAISAFKWDAALTSAFFGARPLYYGIRRMIGATPFKMFKQPPSIDPSVVTGKQLLMDELDLLKKYGPREGKFKAPMEELTFNLPFGIGKGLWKVVNSQAPFNPFRWLGSPGPTKPGSNSWWPDPVEIQGTMLGRQMVGGQVGPAIAGTLSPAPLFGSGIRNNMATQGDFYLQGVAQNMLGKFAPYANVVDQGIIWTNLAAKHVEGVTAHAKYLASVFDDAAKGSGKIFANENLVSVGKKILQEYRAKLQLDPEGKLIPSKVRSKVIEFLEDQIIRPVGEGKKYNMLTLQQMKGLREQMDDLLKPLKDDVLTETSYADDITQIFKAWETDLASVESMGYPEAIKAWKDYDRFVSQAMLLWGTDAGMSVAKLEKRGFNLVVNNSSTRAGHELFETVVNVAKTKPQNVYSELRAIKTIVGPTGYHNGIGTYIRNQFSKAIGEKDGILVFDATGFKAALGLGAEGTALRTLMESALPGPKVTKFKIFNPEKRMWVDFDDELYASGVERGLTKILKEKVPEGLLKAEERVLPTVQDFEKFANVMEKLFKNGVPSPAKFMMRRAIMSGVRSSLRALLPTTALGNPGATKFAGGAAAGAIGIGPIKMAVLAWLLNYGGKVLTNRVSMAVTRNILDSNLNEAIRLANFSRLVRMYPEEWGDFDRELYELEQREKIYRRSKFVQQDAGSNWQRAKEVLKQNIPSARDVGGALKKAVVEPWGIDPSLQKSLQKTSRPGGAPDDLAPEAEEAGGAYDSSRVGSSIMNNQTMNPAAAGALYAGNTDAALAAQYGGGTQFAAGGGLMELNPVMNNQGKYTDIQTGINDNPFQNSKNKGILGVL